jgi:hypothetical protein
MVQLLTPGLNEAWLLKNKSGFEIVTQLADIQKQPSLVNSRNTTL